MPHFYSFSDTTEKQSAKDSLGGEGPTRKIIEDII